MSLNDTAKDWERNLHLPRENCYKKIQSVSALQNTILLHAIRIFTCVVE